MGSSSELRPPPRGDMSSSSRPKIPSITSMCSTHRSASYFSRIRILYPSLTSAQDLDPPDKVHENLVRLHPALANAQSSFTYATDPEGLLPRPLFSSPGSRRSASSKGSDYRTRMQDYVGNTPATSIQGMKHSRPNLVKIMLAELDAELEALSCYPKRQEKGHGSGGANPFDQYAYTDDLVERGPSIREMLNELTGGVDAANNHLNQVRELVSTRKDRKLAMAESSTSNFKELRAVVASARIQSFKTSSEYLAYQKDQGLISSLPLRQSSAAIERVADFKSTPSWRQYEADLTLVLDFGDSNDMEMISAPLST